MNASLSTNLTVSSHHHFLIYGIVIPAPISPHITHNPVFWQHKNYSPHPLLPLQLKRKDLFDTVPTAAFSKLKSLQRHICQMTCSNCLFLVFTHVIRRPYWWTKQWQNVAQVLHNNRIKFPRDFFHYCSLHQHGCRDVTWKPRIAASIPARG